MKRKLKVLFVASECFPFIKTGGLGDVAGSLPSALNKVGIDCRVIMPKYGQIAEKYKEKMQHICDFYVALSWRREYCGIEKLKLHGITYYFVDNERYFKRDKVYGEYDDGERFAYFSKAILESLQYIGDEFKCDILHCNDWHTALVPVFLREFYRNVPLYNNIKTILTIHNLKFQGQMSDFVLGDVLGLHEIPNAANQLRSDSGSINFMRGGLLYSDVLTTVSPSYAEEIKTNFYGEHLDWIFRERTSNLYGVLNGIDTLSYSPTEEKEKSKIRLQQKLGLDKSSKTPIISIISRLTEQKGLDLIKCVFDEIVELPIQFVVLGTGDKEYEEMFEKYSNRNNVRTILKFDENLSKELYAGSDMLLMPSKFEPCGLSQLIAMRYGTLPIVRETGGLKDTVSWDRGFTFLTYNAHDMLFTIKKAVDIFYNDKILWSKMVSNAISYDSSWDKAAKEYLTIYENLSRQ